MLMGHTSGNRKGHARGTKSNKENNVIILYI